MPYVHGLGAGWATRAVTPRFLMGPVLAFPPPTGRCLPRHAGLQPLRSPPCCQAHPPSHPPGSTEAGAAAAGASPALVRLVGPAADHGLAALQEHQLGFRRPSKTYSADRSLPAPLFGLVHSLSLKRKERVSTEQRASRRSSGRAVAAVAAAAASPHHALPAGGPHRVLPLPVHLP